MCKNLLSFYIHAIDKWKLKLNIEYDVCSKRRKMCKSNKIFLCLKPTMGRNKIKDNLLFRSSERNIRYSLNY